MRDGSMTEAHRTNSKQPVVLAIIHLIPAQGEEDDFETLSILTTVHMQVRSMLSTTHEYTIESQSNHTRDAGAILLLADIVREMISHKDLVMAIFRAGASAIASLAKQGHVGKIEMTIDGNSISIEDADKPTAQRLIDIFEAKHPSKLAALPPSTVIDVIGTVSNIEAPTNL